MKWPEFLSAVSDAEQISLVGPRLGRPHSPNSPTIYIDGGSDFQTVEAAGFPVVSIGDGDSTRKVLDETLPAVKDESDLGFVLRHIPQRVAELDLYGFCGGRHDHELANLGELHAFLSNRSHFTRVRLFDGERVAITGFCNGRVSVDVHGYFSVFVLSPTVLKISGACRYKLNRDRILMPLSSLGLSNEGDGLVEIESGRPAFVLQS